MSSNHRELIPVSAATTDYVLLSMPLVSTRDKVLAHLRAAEAACDLTELGVKLWCRGGANWESLVRMLAAAMSRTEREQTRVAVVPRSDNPMALHAAVFSARTMAEVVAEARALDHPLARAA
jgi:hypothetical protein